MALSLTDQQTLDPLCWEKLSVSKKNPTKDLTLMVEKRGGWSAKLHITGLFDARRSTIHLDAPAAVQ